ncbi:MAG: hypothetical protein KDB56_02545 [Mycobacterium sp.]|nr:hypothetical protein [Mycobacterium sp.]
MSSRLITAIAAIRTLSWSPAVPVAALEGLGDVAAADMTGTTVDAGAGVGDTVGAACEIDTA